MASVIRRSRFVDGATTPIYTYTKAGGYADNYIQLQALTVATFDNLKIENNVDYLTERSPRRSRWVT